MALYMGVPDHNLIFRIGSDSFEDVNHSVAFVSLFDDLLGLLLEKTVPLDYDS